jgi:hypothetical protein
MSEVGGRRPSLPAERVDRFEAVLAELLQRKYREGGGWVGMRLEYWPHPRLEEAAERVGIDLTLRLPLKTEMIILPYGVWVLGPTTAYRRGSAEVVQPCSSACVGDAGRRPRP